MADYSINAVTRRVVFSGSAGTGPYAFSFEVLTETDIAVYFNATLLTLTTDYTVTVNANGTGSVTIVTGSGVPSTPVSSDQITIVGSRDIERTTDFVTAGDFRASAINEQLDSQIIMIQQVAEENKRGLRAPTYDPALAEDGGVLDLTLPTKDSRAGKILAFDSNGNPAVGEDIGNWRGNWAATTAYSVRDLVKDASNYNVYRCNTAHTSSGTTPISSNADSAKWDLVVDAAYAATQASNAAASAAAASTSETNAASSAAAASTSASNAATSESNASTSESNAATSESNAASSASSASASASAAAVSAATAATYAGTQSVDRFNGDGSTTAFTMTASPATENNTMVYISGVYQQKDTYSTSGTTLTFSSAPPSGTGNIEVMHMSTLPVGVLPEAEDGSAAAPSIAFAADTDTGLYRPGADQLGFATGGTSAMTIDAAQDISIGGSVDIATNLVVAGDLTVSGTTTTVDTTNTVISDSLIELNNGAASNLTNDLGIVMERGSTGDNAIIAWDESADGFIVGTTTATGASTGALTISAAPFQAGATTVTTLTTSDYTNIDEIQFSNEANPASLNTNRPHIYTDNAGDLTIKPRTSLSKTIYLTGTTVASYIGGVSMNDGAVLSADLPNIYRSNAGDLNITQRTSAAKSIFIGPNLEMDSSGNIATTSTLSAGDGTFDALKVTTTFGTITGASTGYIDNASGNMRVVSLGPNTSTNGTITFSSRRSDASNATDLLSIGGSTGNATFAGQVGVGSAAESNKKFQVYQSSGSANQLISELRHSGATSPLGVQVYFSGAAPDDNTQWFINCADTGATRLTVWSDGDLANHDGTYGTLSDRFYKTDIVEARDYWDDWKSIGFKTFTKGGKKQFGVIADELEQVFPGLVHTSPDENHPDGESQWVDTMNLNHIGGRVVQELQARVEALEAQLAALSSN